MGAGLNANPGAVPELCQSSLGSKAHGAALGLVFGDPTLSQGTPQHESGTSHAALLGTVSKRWGEGKLFSAALYI